MDLGTKYLAHYSAANNLAVYAVEFVVRAFLGTYSPIPRPEKCYTGKRILDLGYGDGRNMPLLMNLGFEISGVEISEEINEHVRERLMGLGITADLRVGSNACIPFPDAHFDYVLACHSCYYVEPDSRFSDNLREIVRILKPGGFLIASLPMTDTYILHGSNRLPDGHYEITHDPYGLRNGAIFRAFETEKEIHQTFSPYFSNVVIGYCNNFWWGIHEKVWTLMGKKKIGEQ